MSTLAVAPVAVYQDADELGRLVDLYRAMQPKRVLEIGTKDGGTLYQWLHHAAPGATVVTVDLMHVNRDRYREWADDDIHLHVVTGNSHHPRTVAEVASHGPSDFVFVDADHTYDAVKADWDLYRRLCAPGALFAFHDIAGNRCANPEIQVRRLWGEIKAAGFATQEFVTDRDWWGIGVVHL